MTLLEEYKQKRREIDMKIKELESGKFIRCGKQGMSTANMVRGRSKRSSR